MTQVQEYNRNIYETFKKKNADKIKAKCICEICGGKYTYFNKSRHAKSKKHLLSVLKLKYPEDESLKKTLG